MNLLEDKNRQPDGLYRGTFRIDLDGDILMKYCIHCKHIRDMFRPTFEKCAALDGGVDLVTGEPKHTYCSTARALDGPCGHEGKLWEPIEIEVDNATF